MNDRLNILLVAIYSWISAVFFGSIFMDVIYANSLKGVLSVSESTAVFSGVSDFFLRIGFVMVIIGLGAMVAAWEIVSARNLFISSLLCFSFEILVPVFFPFIKNAQGLSWIRLLPSGIASILAFIGLNKYYQQK